MLFLLARGCRHLQGSLDPHQQDTLCTHESPALWLQVANLVTITDCLIRDFFNPLLKKLIKQGTIGKSRKMRRGDQEGKWGSQRVQGWRHQVVFLHFWKS